MEGAHTYKKIFFLFNVVSIKFNNIKKLVTDKKESISVLAFFGSIISKEINTN